MDKRLILAVAGSGKTTHIVNQLNHNKRSLIITYTKNNLNNLHKSILHEFNYIPSNITLMEYFSFLYGFCYRPFLGLRYKDRGINYEQQKYDSSNIRKIPQLKPGTQEINKRYFFDQDNRLKSSRIAKLCELGGIVDKIKYRLEKYFDCLYIDEIQDFAGHDFNLIKHLSQADLEMIFVGDFYQHTFDTSRDGSVNKNLYNDYDDYVKRFKKMGLSVDEECLKKSFRCNPTICSFIRDKLGINIYSHKHCDTGVYWIDSQSQADDLYRDNKIVKLFLRQHYLYDCYSMNWGESKGLNEFQDVCVVLNQETARLYTNDRLFDLAPLTKNKFYVACSRANNNLYFVKDDLFKAYKR